MIKIDKSVLLLLFVRAISSLGTLVFTIVVTKYYGLNDIGNFAIAFGFLSLISLITRFGADSLIVKKVSILVESGDKEGFWKFKRKLYFYYCLLVLCFLLIANYLLPLIESYYSQGVINILNSFLFMLLPFGLLSYLCSSFKAISVPWAYPFFEFGFVSFLISIVMVIINILGYRLEFINYIHLFSVLVFLLVIFGEIYLNGRVKVKFQNSENKGVIITEDSYFEGVGDFLLLNLMAYLITSGFPIIIGAYLDAKEVGVFALCVKISLIANFVLVIINSIFAPRFSVSYHNGLTEELNYHVKKSGFLLCLICIPVLVFITIFSKELFSALNVPESAYIYIYILLLAQLVNIVTGSVIILLNMIGLHKANRNITVLLSVFSLIAINIVLPLYGLGGAIVVLASYWIMKNILSSLYLYTTTGINIFSYLKYNKKL